MIPTPAPEDGLYHFLGAAADPEYRAERPDIGAVTAFILGRDYERATRVPGGIGEVR